jgi:hypothetical protein
MMMHCSCWLIFMPFSASMPLNLEAGFWKTFQYGMGSENVELVGKSGFDFHEGQNGVMENWDGIHSGSDDPRMHPESGPIRRMRMEH